MADIVDESPVVEAAREPKRVNVDFGELEVAFESHSPDIDWYLDRETGAVLQRSDDHPLDDDIEAHPTRYLAIDPVPSREQYRMMEDFIETVPHAALKALLQDAIVGKGAFRRFKDTVGRHADERKRWFAFRDVLLHRFILEWLDRRGVVYVAPAWSTELPMPRAGTPDVEPERPSPAASETDAMQRWLVAWARTHGPEYQYLFGPAAFERLAQDMAQAFTFSRRK